MPRRHNSLWFWVGFAVNVAALLALVLLIRANFLPETAALGIAFVVMAAYTGGFLPGITSSILYGIFVLVLLGPVDIPRTINVVVVGIFMGGLLGYAREREWAAEQLAAQNQRKADFVDGINGNLAKLDNTIQKVDVFLIQFQYLDREGLERQARIIRGMLVDLMTTAQGWHLLAIERGLVEQEFEEGEGQ